MLKVDGLDHIVLRAIDAPVLIAFYKDVLGCSIERELEPHVGLTQLRAGRSLIDIVAVDSELGRTGGAPPGPEGRNMDHFCVTVSDFDEDRIRAHLRAHGIEAGNTTRRYGAQGYGPSIYVQDPEGNTVELKGPSEDA